MSRQEAQYQKTSKTLGFYSFFDIELLLCTLFFNQKNNKTSITFAIIFPHRIFFEFRWIWESIRGPNPFKFEEKMIQKIVSFSTSVLVDISSILEPKMLPRWAQDASKMPLQNQHYYRRRPRPLQTSIFFDVWPSRAVFFKIFGMIFDVILHSKMLVKSYNQLSKHFSFRSRHDIFSKTLICTYWIVRMF